MAERAQVAPLNIYLFGAPRARFGEHREVRFPTQKTLELMAFTGLSKGHALSRERVATVLRDNLPDAQSRRALSTDIWRLRQLFQQAGTNSETYLHADRHTVGFRPDAPVFLDVLAFERTADTALQLGPNGLDDQQIRALDEALSLYRDDALVSLDREWCLILREKLRAKYIACVDLLLTRHLLDETWPRALQVAKRLIELDPLLEHGHRAAMQCHFMLGNRAAALRQYGECADHLRVELGIEPSEETQRMYHGLIPGPLPARQAAVVLREPARPARTGGPDLVAQLHEALSELDSARTLILEATRSLKGA